METLNFKSIPVLPTRNTLVYPGLAVPLRVGRPKSMAAIRKAQESDGWIVSVLQKRDRAGDDVTVDELNSIGTLCKIETLSGSSGEGFQVVLRGQHRFRVDQFSEGDGMLLATGEEFPDIAAKNELDKQKNELDEQETQFLLQNIKALAKNLLEFLPVNSGQVTKMIDEISDLSFLTFLCAGYLDLSTSAKQEVLEISSVSERAKKVLDLMQKYKDQIEVQSEINQRLSRKLGRSQREAILREQLKAIREELGEDEESVGNEDYKKRIDESSMPEDVRKIAMDELRRLEKINSQSPETHVIRSYLDLLCSLPWQSKSTPEVDLEKAKNILNEDHHGLTKIKQRILQHLAVMKLKKDKKGSILLFVGPPGVGKTSLGQSIARALDRKFVRVSLGGVRDDAEIRGHRRTYVGAMPGRIIQGIKRANEKNPVFMLDEIDKMLRGFQGDPGGALLEVLDPEQNMSFVDHYLDVPYDLSEVMFIATANTLETISGPLLDRMEIIELTGYTTEEKLHIANKFLLPKLLKEHGLNSEQLQISDGALKLIITNYTREAGVRDLSRKIATICRASAEKVLISEPDGLPVRVEAHHLDELLGQERFQPEKIQDASTSGVVTGLAWTPMGGDILFIESSVMSGQGKLILTGQLGEVMKESAQIALSVVRSHIPALSSKFSFERNDIHLHVPSGAIPKDGPSAGVAMLTALASLLSGKVVSSELAMTGELTLRGVVMPVGGIKEKILAAHRAGIRTVILPKRNERDLQDVPEEVCSSLKFHFVEKAEEVLRIALNLNLNDLSIGEKGPFAVA